MSLVTSACLYVDYAPTESHKRLLEPLPFDSREQAFKKIPWQAGGGTKGMIGDVYLAGFNFVLPDDLVGHVREVLGPAAIAVLVVNMEDDPDVHVFGSEVTVHPHER